MERLESVDGMEARLYHELVERKQARLARRIEKTCRKGCLELEQTLTKSTRLT